MVIPVTGVLSGLPAMRCELGLGGGGWYWVCLTVLLFLVLSNTESDRGLLEDFFVLPGTFRCIPCLLMNTFAS